MNDMFHDVSVGARRDRRKHIARRECTALHHRRKRSVSASLHDVRYFVKRTLEMRIPLQDCCQQKSVPTAHIHDGMDAVKTVGRGYGGAVNRGKCSHGVMENL